MNYAGDAAEQVVRMSLEGTEFALRITGAAAKNIAAMLYAVLKEQKKTKGKARVESMLREKRPTTIYKVKKEDCPEFAKQAKRYGVKYAPIPVRKDDNTVDIMVFEDDAARVNRIVEKFDLVAENTASIKDEIAKPKQTRGSEQAPPEQAAPEKSEEDKLVDEMLEKPAQKEKSQQEIPSVENADSFPKAAENPLRPRLPPGTEASPQRVLLNRQRNPSVRNCGRFRRRGSRKRIGPMRKKPPPRKSPRRKPLPINSRLKSGNPNQRRGNAR